MGRSPNFSKVKFEEKICNELNSILRTKVSDPRTQFMSITHVNLNNDFSVATVYWDTFSEDNKEDCKAAIEKMGGNLRTKLAKTIKVRHVPLLKFSYNSQFEDETKITNLLKGLESK